MNEYAQGRMSGGVIVQYGNQEFPVLISEGESKSSIQRKASAAVALCDFIKMMFEIDEEDPITQNSAKLAFMVLRKMMKENAFKEFYEWIGGWFLFGKIARLSSPDEEVDIEKVLDDDDSIVFAPIEFINILEEMGSTEIDVGDVVKKIAELTLGKATIDSISSFAKSFGKESADSEDNDQEDDENDDPSSWGTWVNK